MLTRMIRREHRTVTSRRKHSRPRTARFESLESKALLAVSIHFDYSYDADGFFDTQQSRQVLEQAGRSIGDRLQDSLAAIVPQSPNGWWASFDNPATGLVTQHHDLVVPADTIIIYVGSRDLGENNDGIEKRAEADTSWRDGGGGIFGAQDWKDHVRTRGQTGTSTWGGSITFSSGVTGWHKTVANVPPNKTDLYTVALHEIGHILGFDGDNPLFRNQAPGGQFRGSHAMSVFGDEVPLQSASNKHHWDSSVRSGQQGPAAMIPYGPQDGFQRRVFTELDFAALADIGWEVSVAPIAGDNNGDSRVGQEDLDLVLLHWGDSVEQLPDSWANPPITGRVDQAVLDAVLLNWGEASSTRSPRSYEERVGVKHGFVPSMAADNDDNMMPHSGEYGYQARTNLVRTARQTARSLNGEVGEDPVGAGAFER